MKKTYQVKKQAKLHRARKIIIHVGVQFFIVAMMLGFIYQSRSASGENTNRITVTVNDAYYDYGPQRRSPKFFIHTSTGTYRFIDLSDAVDISGKSPERSRSGSGMVQFTI